MTGVSAFRSSPRQFGTVISSWNSYFQLEQLLPAGTVTSSWNSYFQLEQLLPVEQLFSVEQLFPGWDRRSVCVVCRAESSSVALAKRDRPQKAMVCPTWQKNVQYETSFPDF